MDVIEKEIVRILDMLEDCDDSYYVEGKSLIPDDAYNQLRRELIATPRFVDAIRKMREEDVFEDYRATVYRFNSMTKKIGTSKIARPTVKRERKMLSMQNAYDSKEAHAFCERIQKKLGTNKVRMNYMSKYDGLSIELIYTFGELSLMSLRGDGQVGDDVTHMYPLFSGVPDTVSAFNEYEVRTIRGEALMSKAHFKQLNELRVQQGLDEYISARSAVAARLNNSAPDETGIPLLFVAFDDLEQTETQNYNCAMKTLSVLGFHTPVLDLFTWDYSLASFPIIVESFTNHRPWHVFDIDGIVISVDEAKHRRALGEGVRTPNYAFAYKFEPSTAVTVLEGIEITVGRTGIITPVASLRPVQLNHITCTRANLHNFANIVRKDIRIGDAVIVERAGDVIPDIQSVVMGLRNDLTPRYSPPTKCPSCGSTLAIFNNYTQLMCCNTKCGSQTHNRLINAAYRNALNLKGLGPAAIEDLIAHFGFENTADLLSIDESHLQTLFGENSPRVATIAASIESAKTVLKASVAGLGRLIFSLSIPEVGKTTADNLAGYFGSLGAFSACTEEQLKQITGVGAERSGLIIAWLLIAENARTIERLIEMGYGVDHGAQQVVKDDSDIVVFSGVFSAGTRDVMETMALDMGYAIAKKVSKKTRYVVMGDKPGSAISEADRLGIELLTEHQWFEMNNRPTDKLPEW